MCVYGIYICMCIYTYIYTYIINVCVCLRDSGDAQEREIVDEVAMTSRLLTNIGLFWRILSLL